MFLERGGKGEKKKEVRGVREKSLEYAKTGR